MSDTFTKHRFEWLDAIASDSRLHSTAIRVAVVIATHLNRQSGKAFPSIKTISAKSATPERTVKHQISALCRAGYLEKRRGGFSKSNIYVMAGIATEDAGNPPVSSGAMDCPSGADSGAMGCPNESPSGAMGCPSDGQWVAPRSGNGLPPNPLNEPFEKEPSEKYIYPPPPAPKPSKPKAKPKVQDERFEAFWSAYPKKVARADAVKAWGKALKAADADTLIAGALRYAAEQHGKDPTYTKHPATWLNKGCWTDEPAPPRPPSAPAPRGGLTAKDRTAAAVAAVLAQVGGGDHEL